MNENNTPVLLLEKAIAAHLSTIKGVRVDRYADSFTVQGEVTQSKQLRIGHSGSSYQVIEDGQRGTTIERETAQFEMGCEVADFGNHEQALALIGEAMQMAAAFQPYEAIAPFTRVSYGDAKFDRGRGVWEYVGVIQTSFNWKNGQPPIMRLIADMPTNQIPIIRVWRGDETGKVKISETNLS